MKKKYTNARYPEKINDLVDNNGKVSEGALGDYATKQYVAEAINGAITAALEATY